MSMELLLGLSASAFLCFFKKESGVGEMTQLLKAGLTTKHERNNWKMNTYHEQSVCKNPCSTLPCYLNGKDFFFLYFICLKKTDHCLDSAEGLFCYSKINHMKRSPTGFLRKASYSIFLYWPMPLFSHFLMCPTIHRLMLLRSFHFYYSHNRKKRR